jgi:hypothetical protein
MPVNPANFRFSGVDGRGRQTLTRDPRNGGVAIVRIEDPDSGSEGYTFDLTWEGGFPGGNPPPVYRGGDDRRDERRDNERDDDRYRRGYRDSEYYRRFNHGFTTDEAIRVCQNEIYNQAARRYPGAEIHFDRTRIDDNPGRQDWVIGEIDVHRGPRGDHYRFGCSVNFESGRVRSADLDSRPLEDRR